MLSHRPTPLFRVVCSLMVVLLMVGSLLPAYAITEQERQIQKLIQKQRKARGDSTRKAPTPHTPPTLHRADRDLSGHIVRRSGSKIPLSGPRKPISLSLRTPAPKKPVSVLCSLQWNSDDVPNGLCVILTQKDARGQAHDQVLPLPQLSVTPGQPHAKKATLRYSQVSPEAGIQFRLMEHTGDQYIASSRWKLPSALAGKTIPITPQEAQHKEIARILQISRITNDLVVSVHMADGHTVPSVPLYLTWSNSLGEAVKTAVAQTTQAGSVVFHNVPAGLPDLEIRLADTSTPSAIVLAKNTRVTNTGQTAIQVALTALPARADVAVKFVGEDGAPLKSTPVTLLGYEVAPDTQEYVCVGNKQEQKTDADGIAKFASIPVGLQFQARVMTADLEVVQGTERLPDMMESTEMPTVKVKLIKRPVRLQFLPALKPGIKVRLLSFTPGGDAQRTEESITDEKGEAHFSDQPISNWYRCVLAGPEADNWTLQENEPFDILPPELQAVAPVLVDEHYNYVHQVLEACVKPIHLTAVTSIVVQSDPPGAEVFYPTGADTRQVLGVTPVTVRVPEGVDRLFLHKGYGLETMLDISSVQPAAEGRLRSVTAKLVCKKIADIIVAGQVNVGDSLEKVREKLGEDLTQEEKNRKSERITKMPDGSVWWLYPQRGLSLHIRNIALGRTEDRRVDVIRLTAPAGGAVEGVAVGESEAKLLAPEATLGPPESVHDDPERKFCYVDNGVRLLVQNGQVSTIEIARPTEKLHTGVLEFVRPVRPRFYVRPLQDRSGRAWPALAEEARRDVRWILDSVGTYETVETEADADYVISGWVNAEASGKEGEEAPLGYSRERQVPQNYLAKYRDVNASTEVALQVTDLETGQSIFEKKGKSRRMEYRVYRDPRDRPSKGDLDKRLLEATLGGLLLNGGKIDKNYLIKLVGIVGAMYAFDSEFRYLIEGKITDEHAMARAGGVSACQNLIQDLYAVRPVEGRVIAIAPQTGEISVNVGEKDGITKMTEFLLENSLLPDQPGTTHNLRMEVVTLEADRTILRLVGRDAKANLARLPDAACGALFVRTTIPRDLNKRMQVLKHE